MEKVRVLFFFFVLSHVPLAMAQGDWQEALKLNRKNLKIDSLSDLELGFSKAQKRQTWSRFLPSLTAGVSDAQIGDQGSRTQSVFLKGQLNLFNGFSDYHLWREFDLREELQQQRSLISRQSEDKDFILLYLAWVRSSERLVRLERLFLYKTRALKVAVDKFERGQLSKQDVEKFEVDLANTESSLSDQKLSLTQDQETLRLRLGLEVLDLKPQWPKVEVLLKENWKPSVLDLHLTPEWQIEKKQAEIQNSLVDQARGRLWPQLNLSLSQGEDRVDFQTSRKSWNAMLELSLNLFDGLKDHYGLEQSKISRLQNEIRQSRVERELRTKASILLKNFSESQKSARKRQEILTKAQDLLEDNLNRFKFGRASVNELLVDHERLFQSQSLSIEGIYQLHTLWVQICSLRGEDLLSCEPQI